MKSHQSKVEKSIPVANSGSLLKPCVSLAIGIILTIVAAFLTENAEEIESANEFRLTCGDIVSKIETRLHNNAQLLRSGAAFFIGSDTITRSEWKEFCERLKIEKNLPGIQGFGFSMIIKKQALQQHIRYLNNEGFKQYSIKPAGDRNIYTSIIYLEPFTERNLRAFGYDMFTEPTRRKAMELSRDSDIAMLSGKVNLLQETDTDIQSGTLMYVPVYTNGMPIKTIEQRRAAIKGWVYSPYRMGDLMWGILGRWDEHHMERIQLRVFDEYKSVHSLLFNSLKNDTLFHSENACRAVTFPIVFNGKKWILCFNQSREQIPVLHGKVLLVLLTGFIISILLFFLSLYYFKTRYRALLLDKLNAELVFQNEEKGKRANELVLANVELAFQNEEKGKRADELFLANVELAFQNEEKVKRADELIRANNELSFRLNELNQFAYISNHDMQEPLRMLTTFSQMLKENYKNKLDNEGNGYIDFIHNSALRMSKMVKDLFVYSLLGKDSIKTLLDCNKIVEVVLNDMDDSIKEKNAHIVVKELPTLYGYETELRLLFHNLVANAIMYQKTGSIPEINIEAESCDKTWLFKIYDNGIGIDEKYRDKIFIIFQRLHKRNEYGGTGIGLAYCKKVVELHGGKIWVESTLGEGSTFLFTIPKN